MQYLFDYEEHPVISKAHGNSKSTKGFARSKASTLQKIKAKTQIKGPSQVYDEEFEEAGGMLTFESLGGTPKGRKQVENVKYNSGGLKDPKMNYTILLRRRRWNPSPTSGDYN